MSKINIIIIIFIIAVILYIIYVSKKSGGVEPSIFVLDPHGNIAPEFKNKIDADLKSGKVSIIQDKSQIMEKMKDFAKQNFGNKLEFRNTTPEKMKSLESGKKYDIVVWYDKDNGPFKNSIMKKMYDFVNKKIPKNSFIELLDKKEFLEASAKMKIIFTPSATGRYKEDLDGVFSIYDLSRFYTQGEYNIIIPFMITSKSAINTGTVGQKYSFGDHDRHYFIYWGYVEGTDEEVEYLNDFKKLEKFLNDAFTSMNL